MMNISEFERNKPRETLKQINNLIEMSNNLKKSFPKLSVCKSQEDWVVLTEQLNSINSELKKLKKIFKEGK